MYATNLTVETLEDLTELVDSDLKVDNEDWQTDNNARARRAAVAVLAYAEAHDRGEPLETVISDLLGDLMHLCDAVVDDEGEERVDFDFVVARARNDYSAEVEGVV